MSIGVRTVRELPSPIGDGGADDVGGVFGDGATGGSRNGADLAARGVALTNDIAALRRQSLQDFIAQNPGMRPDTVVQRYAFGPDSAVPSYLTVDAAGQVGADFSGHVAASGFDMVAGESASRIPGVTSAAPDELAWHVSSMAGNILEKLFTIHGPGAAGKLIAGAIDTAGNETDKIVLGSDGTTEGSSSTIHSLFSDFLMRVGNNNRLVAVAFGSGTFTWPGGTTTTTTTVTHNLGYVPVFTTCEISSTFTNDRWHTHSSATTSTTATFAANGDGGGIVGAGTSRNFYWLAIG